MILSKRWLREGKKTLLTLWEFIGSSIEETWIPIIQGCFVPRLVQIGAVVLGKSNFNFANVFSPFRIYPPWERVGPSFEET